MWYTWLGMPGHSKENFWLLKGNIKIKQRILPHNHQILLAIIDLYFGINTMNPLFLAAGKIILKKKTNKVNHIFKKCLQEWLLTITNINTNLKMRF